jgi:hypothetical protein
MAGWAEFVRAHLRARGVPIEEAARRLGVPVSTFRTWLDGHHLPGMSIFEQWAQLAELLGVAEVELLRVAGLLPDTVAGPMLVAQANRQLRESLDHAGRLLRQASSLAQTSSVSQVVNALSSSGVDWEIQLRSAHRGRDLRLTYHHYVGIIPPEPLAGWGVQQIRDYVQHDLLAHLWQPLSLYWRVAHAHDWPSAPELLIQVPDQEASRPPSGQSPRPTADPVLVLSPPWGYGELLGSLVADGIGFGNIDFRYFGIPDDLPQRLAVLQAELDGVGAGFVLSVPPLVPLDGLVVGAAQLAGRLPILITYGERVRLRGTELYRPALTRLAGDAERAIALVVARNAAAVQGLPPGSDYIEVVLADDDVVAGDLVDRHLMNDTIAWLALAVTGMILARWGVPPRPVGGPLRDLVLPSGRPRQPPPMASRATWRTVL